MFSVTYAKVYIKTCCFNILGSRFAQPLRIKYNAVTLSASSSYHSPSSDLFILSN